MRIGTLTIDPPVWMAPMAGITDSPFRRMVRSLGCPAVVTEMISSEGIIRRGKGSLALLNFFPEEKPISAQIFGAKPEVMAEAARIVAGHGFDLVDINMGCPVKKVVRSGSGAALMRDPQSAAKIVSAVRKAVNLPVTVKIRAGWNSEETNALEFAKALVEEGADAITLHPRTRTQFYSGAANWDLISKLVEHLSVPVIGNGDIKTPSDAKRMMESTHCAGVMVGRAAMGDPFLPGAIAGAPYPPSRQKRYEAFCTHLDLVIGLLGSEHRAVLCMRKHLAWYARGMPGAAKLRRTLDSFENASDMKLAIERIASNSDLKEGEGKSES